MDKVAKVLMYLLILVSLALWAHHDWLAALAAWSTGVTLYLILHLVRQRQLSDWLSGKRNQLPEASGDWANIFSNLQLFEQTLSNENNALNASMSRFKHAVGVLPDGVVIFNERQQIEWCNPAAEQQLGIDLSRDINEKLNAGVHHPDAVVYLQSQNLELPLRTQAFKNAQILLEIKVYRFGAQQKIMLSQDITQTEQLDAVRRDFIANVSHELRTPLTVVGGFLETLQDNTNAVSKTFQPYLLMMEQQTLRMRHLVDDLLTISRMESNPLPPEDKPIDVENLTTRMLEGAKILSQGKHQFKTKIQKDLYLLGAEDEVFTALNNLIVNAVRYSPEGGIINITWNKLGENASFSVQDTGIGIAPEHITRITERFYRVDKSRSRETGGTGLGLSIVKRILTRHQAQLSIESTENIGSTFSAIFPPEKIVKKTNT